MAILTRMRGLGSFMPQETLNSVAQAWARYSIIVVTVIYQFTNIWNDFLFGASYAAGDTMPMTVALNNVVNTSTGVVEYDVNMAAAMIAALPTLLVYILAGRYFVRGLMAGALKG